MHLNSQHQAKSLHDEQVAERQAQDARAKVESEHESERATLTAEGEKRRQGQDAEYARLAAQARLSHTKCFKSRFAEVNSF